MARVDLTPQQAGFLDIHLGVDPDPPGDLETELAALDPAGIDPAELWRAAAAEVDAITGRISGELRRLGSPDADRIAEFGFLGLTGGHHVRLMGAILGCNSAAAADRPAAVKALHKVVDAFAAHVEGDPVLAICGQFPGSADVRVPMRRALAAIRKLPA